MALSVNDFPPEYYLVQRNSHMSSFRYGISCSLESDPDCLTMTKVTKKEYDHFSETGEIPAYVKGYTSDFEPVLVEYEEF